MKISRQQPQKESRAFLNRNLGWGVGIALAFVVGMLVGHQEWQGALPFRYHLGPGPVQTRLVTADDGAISRIWNTLGLISGAQLPDEWIIIGGHRDSWCRGAADNVAGVAAVAFGLGPDLFPGWGSMGQREQVTAVRDRILTRTDHWASLGAEVITEGHVDLASVVRTTPPRRPTCP